MTGLREHFGRPLRLGIIGGGPDAWIGRMQESVEKNTDWNTPAERDAVIKMIAEVRKMYEGMK